MAFDTALLIFLCSYEGEFKDGRISGIGEFRMRDGSVYIGTVTFMRFKKLEHDSSRRELC
jgi:hypothetical protein